MAYTHRAQPSSGDSADECLHNSSPRTLPQCRKPQGCTWAMTSGDLGFHQTCLMRLSLAREMISIAPFLCVKLERLDLEKLEGMAGRRYILGRLDKAERPVKHIISDE